MRNLLNITNDQQTKDEQYEHDYRNFRENHDETDLDFDYRNERED